MTEQDLVPLVTRDASGSAAVEVAVPAHPNFVATIRAVTRSASVLADLSLSDVEELQIAVDEAATLLLPLVEPTGQPSLFARLEIAPGCVRILLHARCRGGAEVDTSGMAWVMLTGLDPAVKVTREGDDVSIGIERMRSGADQ